MAFTASWIYQIVDKYSGPIRKIRKATDRARKAMKKASAAVGRFGAKMTSAQSGIASFAGVLGGAMMLSTFNNFETSMNKLGAVSLANSEDMAKFRDIAKQLGETTQFSAGQVADGMVFLKMAGLETNKVMEAIPGTLQLAAAGGIELAQAADIATNVLMQMGLEVKDLTRVNDVLATIQSKANTDILQAAEAMGKVGATASSLGISLEQTTAFIGAMANAGTKGGESGTLLRNMMLKMVNPTTKARKALKELNIDMRQFVTPEGKIKDLTGFVDKLGTSGATTAQIFNILEERGGRAFLSLSKSGKVGLQKLEQAMANVTGNAEKMADIMMKGLPGALKVLKSVWEATIIALFESGFVDLVLDIVKGISKMLQVISRASPMLLKIVGIMGLLAVALGPVLMIIGFLSMAVSSLLAIWPVLSAFVAASITPFVGIAAAIAAVVALVIRAFTTNSRLRESFMKIIAALSPIIDLFKMLWDMMGGTESMTSKLVWVFDLLADIIGSVLVGAFEMLAVAIKIALFPLSLIMKGAEMLFGGEGGGVAAGAAAGNKATLNGTINVSATGGAKVNSAEMASDTSGDLGFNMGGG